MNQKNLQTKLDRITGNKEQRPASRVGKGETHP